MNRRDEISQEQPLTAQRNSTKMKKPFFNRQNDRPSGEFYKGKPASSKTTRHTANTASQAMHILATNACYALVGTETASREMHGSYSTNISSKGASEDVVGSFSSSIVVSVDRALMPRDDGQKGAWASCVVDPHVAPVAGR